MENCFIVRTNVSSVKHTYRLLNICSKSSSTELIFKLMYFSISYFILLFLFPGSPWHINIMHSSPGLTPLGESTKLIPVNTPAVFEILPPPGSSLKNRGECVASVLAPNKSKVNARISHEAANGAMRIEFIPKEVGTHIIEASISGTKLTGGPLVAKVYDSSLIQVSDVNSGVVGQPCQFRGRIFKLIRFRKSDLR